MKRLIFPILCTLFLQTARAQETATVTAPPPPTPPSGEWKAKAGFSALLNTGNSNSQSFGGNGLASYKWDKNKLESTAIGAYGRSKTAGVSTVNTENWKTTGRYDRFVTDPISLFTLGHISQDRPAGFDSRYGISAGFSHEIYKVDPNFFKYELGFDFTHENLVAGPDDDVYSVRYYMQYKRTFTTYAEFSQDAESFFDLQTGKNVRLNTLTALTAKLTNLIGFQFGFQVKFDNVPPPGKKKTDTVTQAGLIVTLL